MKFVEGKNIPATFKNETKYITLPEIEYAYSLGYDIVLLSAVISKRSTYIFREYIDKLYARRIAAKKEMKKF
tara:strand:- start:915 stop:1130 length:216 start_codon:yes stop_codon:yes gene_type:complete